MALFVVEAIRVRRWTRVYLRSTWRGESFYGGDDHR